MPDVKLSAPIWNLTLAITLANAPNAIAEDIRLTGTETKVDMNRSGELADWSDNGFGKPAQNPTVNVTGSATLEFFRLYASGSPAAVRATAEPGGDAGNIQFTNAAKLTASNADLVSPFLLISSISGDSAPVSGKGILERSWAKMAGWPGSIVFKNLVSGDITVPDTTSVKTTLFHQIPYTYTYNNGKETFNSYGDDPSERGPFFLQQLGTTGLPFEYVTEQIDRDFMNYAVMLIADSGNVRQIGNVSNDGRRPVGRQGGRIDIQNDGRISATGPAWGGLYAEAIGGTGEASTKGGTGGTITFTNNGIIESNKIGVRLVANGAPFTYLDKTGPLRRTLPGDGGIVTVQLTGGSISTSGDGAVGVLAQANGAWGGGLILREMHQSDTNPALNALIQDADERWYELSPVSDGRRPGAYRATFPFNYFSHIPLDYTGAFKDSGVGNSSGLPGGDGGEVHLKTAAGSRVSTTGERAHGIVLEATGGFGGNAYEGGVWILGKDANGGNAGKGGKIDLDLAGTVRTTGQSAIGVYAYSASGGVAILPDSMRIQQDAGLTSAGDANSGIWVGFDGGKGQEGGDVRMTTRDGLSIGTLGYGSPGVSLNSLGGSGGKGGNATGVSFNITLPDVNLNVGFALGGDGGEGGPGGEVRVNSRDAPSATGKQEIFTFGGMSPALLAQSKGGGGGIGGIANLPAVSIPVNWSAASLTFNYTKGGNGGTGGAGSTVEVNNIAGIATFGPDSSGIMATSIGGGGGAGGAAKLVAAQFNMATNNVSWSEVQGGEGGHGGGGGIVEVFNKGDIVTVANNSKGIQATSIGGGGSAGGDATTNSLVFTPAKARTATVTRTSGGAGGEGGTGGRVTVENYGNIQTGTALNGAQANAIMAQSIGGGGGNGGFAGTFSWNVMTAVDAAKDAVESLLATAGEEIPGLTSALQNSGVASSYGDFKKAVDEKKGDGSTDLSYTSTTGGNGGKGGHGGDVIVENMGTASTEYSNAVAIFAQSVGGGGGNTGIEQSQLGVKARMSIERKVGGNAGAGGDGGRVVVEQAGIVTTQGSGSGAIFAQSVGGGGGKAGDKNLTPSDAMAQAQALQESLEAIPGSITEAVGKTKKILTDTANAVKTRIRETADAVKDQLTSAVGLLNLQSTETPGLTQATPAEPSDATDTATSDTKETAASDTTDAKPPKSAADLLSELEVKFNQTVGGNGGAGGKGGDVLVFSGGKTGNTQNSSITTQGDLATVIYAQSVGGGGGDGAAAHVETPGYTKDEINVLSEGKVVQNVKDLLKKIRFSSATGGAGGAGGDGGKVAVDLMAGSLESFGRNAHLVFAQSIGGGGGNSGAATDTSSGWVSFSVKLGGSDGAHGNGGAIRVHANVVDSESFIGRAQDKNNLGPITLTTHGDFSAGIFAQSVGGGGGTNYLLATDAYEKFPDLRPLQFSSDVQIDVLKAQYNNQLSLLSGQQGTLSNDSELLSAVTDPNHQSGATIVERGDGENKALYTIGYQKPTVSQNPGNGGQVDVDLRTTTLETYGFDAPGISATSIGGGGGRNFVTNDEGLYSVAIIEQSEPGNTSQATGQRGGSVTTGLIESTVHTEGDFSYAIKAHSIGGGGGFLGVHDGVLFQGAGSLTPDERQSRFAAGNSAEGGAVRIALAGTTVATKGHGAHGVFAMSAGGGARSLALDGGDLILLRDHNFQAHGGSSGVDINLNASQVLSAGSGAAAVLALRLGNGVGTEDRTTIRLGNNTVVATQATDRKSVALGVIGAGDRNTDIRVDLINSTVYAPIDGESFALGVKAGESARGYVKLNNSRLEGNIDLGANLYLIFENGSRWYPGKQVHLAAPIPNDGFGWESPVKILSFEDDGSTQTMAAKRDFERTEIDFPNEVELRNSLLNPGGPDHITETTMNLGKGGWFRLSDSVLEFDIGRDGADKLTILNRDFPNYNSNHQLSWRRGNSIRVILKDIPDYRMFPKGGGTGAEYTIIQAPIINDLERFISDSGFDAPAIPQSELRVEDPADSAGYTRVNFVMKDLDFTKPGGKTLTGDDSDPESKFTQAKQVLDLFQEIYATGTYLQFPEQQKVLLAVLNYRASNFDELMDNLAALNPQRITDNAVYTQRMIAGKMRQDNLNSCEYFVGDGVRLDEESCAYLRGSRTHITSDGYGIEVNDAVLGGQKAFDAGLVIGGLVTVGTSDMDSADGTQSRTADTFSLGAVVKKRVGDFQLALSGLYSQDSADQSRILSSPFTDSVLLSGSNTARSLSLSGRLAYYGGMAPFYFKPMVDVSATYLSADSYTEQGNTAFRKYYDGYHYWTYGVQPALEIGMRHDFNKGILRTYLRGGKLFTSGQEQSQRSYFVDYPDAIITDIANESDDYATLKVGAEYVGNDRFFVEGSYSGMFGGDFSGHKVMLRAGLRF